MIFDACGNLLLVALCDENDAALRGASALARGCFGPNGRHADGVVCFAPRDGFVRTCFFNPDESFERVCGNSLLVAAALFSRAGIASVVRPFEHADVSVVATSSGTLSASAEVELRTESIDAGHHGRALVCDTGSPHAVIEVPDAARCDLAAILGALAGRNVNLTVFSRGSGVLHARTLERGVGAETLACGTGALAVAIGAGPDGAPVEVAYPGGRYRVGIERSGTTTRWTLEVGAESVRRVPAP